jgi:RimJ/RimL family protein N-acetyltransferase
VAFPDAGPDERKNQALRCSAARSARRGGYRLRLATNRTPRASTSIVEIVTERLSLRPFRVDDLETFVAYRSDPEVARYQSWDRTYSMADAESFLSSQREVEFGQPGEWLQLAIVDRETGTVCGDCAVRVVTDQPATAEVGVTVAPANQGKGLATEALTAVVTELFEQRGMHRVFAQADERNIPVRGLLERLGFRCEARLVEADWFKGEWSTLRLYAMLDREWRARPNAERQ